MIMSPRARRFLVCTVAYVGGLLAAMTALIGLIDPQTLNLNSGLPTIAIMTPMIAVVVFLGGGARYERADRPTADIPIWRHCHLFAAIFMRTFGWRRALQSTGDIAWRDCFIRFGLFRGDVKTGAWAVRHSVYSATRLSRTSCWRNGVLSMFREISRTSQGAGIRMDVLPSLSMIASMNARGRSDIRSADLAAGSVSMITTTSRSANASGRAASSSICCTNCGSSGLCANTTIGRPIQTKSAGSISVALKMWVRSASHVSNAVCATVTEARQLRTALRISAFIPINIGGVFQMTTSNALNDYKNISKSCAA
jgi:hypothetical protein